LLGVEAVVFFKPEQALSFEHRRKRGGHLFSKHRYLSAQMAAYLRNDLWIELATRANASCTRLVAGLRQSDKVSLLFEPEANMIFASWPRAWHQRAFAAGASYHMWEGDLEGDDPDEILSCRLVTDWSQSDAQVDAFVNAVLND
jgi:threonine aldolase